MSNLAEPPSKPKRLIYLGTPDVAVPPLLALHEAGFEIIAVVSGPDMRRGRGKQTTPSPVKAAALELGLTVLEDLDDASLRKADIGVVVAFGKIINEQTLKQLPMLNLHFSKLPRWRGAAPVERALLAGDSEIAVCLMGLEKGLDTGPIYACENRSITSGDTAATIREDLSVIGAKMLVRELTRGLNSPTPQTGDATYAHKLDKQDYLLDWKDSAAAIDRVVRLGNARTRFRGKVLKIHAATIASGCDLSPGEIRDLQVGSFDQNLELVLVQPEGKGPMAAKAWLNGVQLESGEKLGI